MFIASGSWETNLTWERLSVSFGPCEGGVDSSEVGVSQLPQTILAEKVNFPELIDN